MQVLIRPTEPYSQYPSGNSSGATTFHVYGVPPTDSDESFLKYMRDYFISRGDITTAISAPPRDPHSILFSASNTVYNATATLRLPSRGLLDALGKSSYIGNRYIPKLDGTDAALKYTTFSATDFIGLFQSDISSSNSYYGTVRREDFSEVIDNHIVIFSVDVDPNVTKIFISNRTSSPMLSGIRIVDAENRVVFYTPVTTGTANAYEYVVQEGHNPVRVCYVTSTGSGSGTYVAPIISMIDERVSSYSSYAEMRYYTEIEDVSIVRYSLTHETGSGGTIKEVPAKEILEISHVQKVGKAFVPRPMYIYGLTRQLPPTYITPNYMITGVKDVL